MRLAHGIFLGRRQCQVPSLKVRGIFGILVEQVGLIFSRHWDVTTLNLFKALGFSHRRALLYLIQDGC